MTLFEYIAIAFSLVLSFAIVRCVTGLPYALAKGHYWTHVIWICATLGTCLLEFWTFWFSRDVSWTFGQFLLVLANPAMLNVFALILLPEHMETIDSWEQHYYSVRKKLFTAGIVWTILLVVTTTVVQNMPLISLARSYQFIMLSVFMIGYFSKNRLVHRVIAIIPLLILIPLMAMPADVETFRSEVRAAFEQDHSLSGE
ncbi:MAG TPA: hypothetical protein DCY55_01760 [Gammaproteobacteria bacterium]|jgi:hypothetical protein|nr:hypothetical protein [Gammaproteobacteria bacterium]